MVVFWRKQRAAIDRFHPLHQDLVWRRGISVSLRRDDWEPVVQSLARHGTEVKRRRWAPPSRVGGVLVPLLRVLAADMRPDGVLSVAADLRGPDLPEKTGPQNQMPVHRPVLSMTQWFTVDPWLRMRAELRDGSVLELTVTDRVRHRKIRKRSASGKTKYKSRTKTVQRIGVTRRLPKGTAVLRPGTPPPRWIAVQVKQGPRMVIRADAKFPGPLREDQLTERILHVTTEPFRWTPPSAARPARRTS